MGGQAINAFKNRRLRGFPDFPGKLGEIPANMVSFSVRRLRSYFPILAFQKEN